VIICAAAVQVFISEQVLYSKSDLERHMRTGDDEGPMAESGFKGHPICRFCRSVQPAQHTTAHKVPAADLQQFPSPLARADVL
jgi:hypothetical protein